MTRRLSNRTATAILLVLGSTLLALSFAEVSLRLVERFSTLRFDALSYAFGESFFFAHWQPGAPLYPPSEKFHSLLGWNAAGTKNRTINAQGWRSRLDYHQPKRKTRVIVAGDSYTFGSNLKDEDTIAEQLQRDLGDQYEVFSLAAEGYGLDQIVLASTQLAPAFSPDHVVIGLIADDLRRSCLSFAWGQALKPTYTEDGGQLQLKGSPVITPEQNARRHQEPRQYWEDRIVALAMKSRVLNLIASPFIRTKEFRCTNHLNARLLEHAEKTLSPRSKLHIVHLDGELPRGFVDMTTKLGVTFSQLKDVEPEIAKELGVTPSTIDGYHPDAARARVIARWYRQLVAGEPATR